jgi:hypothetical protein
MMLSDPPSRVLASLVAGGVRVVARTRQEVLGMHVVIQHRINDPEQ